jgi:D-alanyl-D-alanine dipeptidase
VDLLRADWLAFLDDKWQLWQIDPAMTLRMNSCWAALLAAWGLLAACHSSPARKAASAPAPSPSLPPAADFVPPSLPDTSALERSLLRAGLVNITRLDPEVEVRMMYSTPDNFLGADVYGDFDQCYLQPEAARKLAEASARLREQHPRLRLIVFDCTRPRSVQVQMWALVKGTPQQQYVASPTGRGSMHNLGCAVDLGLVSLDTGLLDMGTPFDFFGELAHPQQEKRFLRSGELSPAQVANREILRGCMRKAGFAGLPNEWWHFIALSPEQARKRYAVVE